MRVGAALWLHGWLLDREELFDRCLISLRRSGNGAQMTDGQIDATILEVGEAMVCDALLGSPSAEEVSGFAEHLVALLGLTEREASAGEKRFHRLSLLERRAFLSLLWAPDGRAETVEGRVPEAFEGLLDDESGTLLLSAERALLALFEKGSMQAKEDHHG